MPILSNFYNFIKEYPLEVTFLILSILFTCYLLILILLKDKKTVLKDNNAKKYVTINAGIIKIIFSTMIYIVIFLAFYLYLSYYANVWYAHIINIIVSFLFVNNIKQIIDRTININADKQLPGFLEDFSDKYEESNRLNTTLHELCNYPVKKYRKLAKDLYDAYYTNFNEVIDSYIRKSSNNWERIFLHLIKVNNIDGGDISPQIDDMVIEVDDTTKIKDHVLKSLLGYRILIVFFLLILPFLINTLISISSINNEYLSTLDGINLVAIYNAFNAVILISIEIYERK